MERKALIVGINKYSDDVAELRSSVADARAMATLLERHKDTTKNFFCEAWLDQTEMGGRITRASLRKALTDLFQFDGEVLFFFAGHGFLSPTGGMLCTQDCSTDDWGIQMQEVVDLSMQSTASQVLLILDCCHAGAFGNPAFLNQAGGKNPLSVLRENMTVVASSKALELSMEAGGHGLFTAALIDGLEGGAADHMGFVTAPSLYAYARRRFAGANQRPVFKTNATDVQIVRECEPLIDRLKLQQLVHHFPTAEFKLRLDPEYEPEDEHGNVREPINAVKVEVAQILKAYRDAGLIRSTDPKLQFFWVARKSETVELTPRGREYWWLIRNDKL